MNIQAVRGMPDVLPADAARWGYVEHQVRRLFASYGLVQIRTPIVEDTGLFARSIGDVTDIVEKDNQIAAFRRELQSENGFHGILGVSELMQQVFDLITNAAQSDAPVIVFGESGTGKELVARSIHCNSGRSRRPFVAFNCGALTEGLPTAQDELFGPEGYLQKALSLDTNQSLANTALGLVRMRQRKFDEAKKYLQKAVASNRKTITHIIITPMF